MRFILFGIRSAVAALALASQALAQPAAAPARPVSPQIHQDHSVTFRLSAPKASEVTLNGSWEGARDIKMTKEENGVWSVTVPAMVPVGACAIREPDSVTTRTSGRPSRFI